MPDRRERLRRLVEFVPEAELPAAERYLESLVGPDPVIRAMVNAPRDDKPFTEGQRKAVEEAERDLAAGHRIPHSEIIARYGLDDEGPDKPSSLPRNEDNERSDGAGFPSLHIRPGRP